MSKYFMVQHNVTNSDFYAEHVADMIAGTPALGPGVKPINDGLMKETNGTLYQHSINFPAGKDAKIGWCVFEAKPESDWTTEKLKEKQDSEKVAWAVQDVYEIMKPAGIESYFSQPGTYRKIK